MKTNVKEKDGKIIWDNGPYYVQKHGDPFQGWAVFSPNGSKLSWSTSKTGQIAQCGTLNNAYALGYQDGFDRAITS